MGTFVPRGSLPSAKSYCLALWLEILGTWESLTHVCHLLNMGVALGYYGPIMCTNSSDSINLWAPWRRVPQITPLNCVAQGTILEIAPFARSVECCLVQINSQMHSWLTSDGRSHQCILPCPLKYCVGREERTKVSFMRVHLLTVSTTSGGEQPVQATTCGCQQGWYLLDLPLP